MTEDDIIGHVSALPGVAVLVASEANGAPEVAWGDSFIYYDPPGAGAGADAPPDRRMPFATIVTQDYPDFDTFSDLSRPGAFRVNISVGRQLFERTFGYPPSAYPDHARDYDYAATDVLIPHPVYARQGWLSVVNPGDRTSARVGSLLEAAHERAAGSRRVR